MVEGYAYCNILYDNGKPVDFAYIVVNAAFEVITGLKEHHKRKKISEVIPDIHKVNPEVLETYNRVVETGVPERFETYVEGLKDWFWVSVYR